MADCQHVLADGDVITLDGQRYRLFLDPPNCTSRGHTHPERHADGSPGTSRHHHHTVWCEQITRQATLYPVDDAGEPLRPDLHQHDFGGLAGFIDGMCPCGATRERAGAGRVRIVNLADDDHPDGWSYHRREVSANDPGPAASR